MLIKKKTKKKKTRWVKFKINTFYVKAARRNFLRVHYKINKILLILFPCIQRLFTWKKTRTITLKRAFFAWTSVSDTLNFDVEPIPDPPRKKKDSDTGLGHFFKIYWFLTNEKCQHKFSIFPRLFLCWNHSEIKKF